MTGTDKIKNKVFVITGSTQGIGKELATQILMQGVKVILNSRRKEKIETVSSLLNQFNNQCHFIAADVSVPAEAQILLSETIDLFGQIDVLINNAGLAGYGQLIESSPVAIEEMIKSNLMGSVFTTHYALPHLVNSKGKILFISSLAALHGLPGYSLYSGSKMALTALYQSLKKELHLKGVFVGIAYVGFTKNDPEKRMIAPNGTLEKMPGRDKFKVVSQEKTAGLILNQIINGEGLRVHSVMGKFAYIISRLFPSLLDHIYLHNYKKSEKN
jgi:short-subunit dehydrogenase